jgi:cyclic pyranopterin phosphate synthase
VGSPRPSADLTVDPALAATPRVPIGYNESVNSTPVGATLAIQMSSPSNNLIDSFGRSHNNLRISVTDRCNIRCVYCMPEQVEFLPRAALLSFEEIERFVRIAVPLGINKIRLTGGEPLVRRNLPQLVEKLAGIRGLKDIGLTTNGILLAPMARALRDAGLERINVSLDTMDAAKFERLTRRTGLERVIEGILAAKEAGFNPVKVNAIAIRGVTEDDVVPLGLFARKHGLELRFIEYMPLDAGHLWEREKVLFAADIHEYLAQGIGPLVPSPDQDPRAPALDYEYADGGGRVGFIASISRPFCQSCNRIRLTSDGKLRNCLFSLEETDIRTLLRTGAPDAEIVRAIRESVASKWEGHEINTARFIQPERLMHSIGG